MYLGRAAVLALYLCIPEPPLQIRYEPFRGPAAKLGS